ncbi:hypothetical protein ASG14_08810 [Pedobacter sp. Leaf194]|nr:hypothetical protein ASG14_08810 [Pedobacter sp. Leaf194]
MKRVKKQPQFALQHGARQFSKFVYTAERIKFSLMNFVEMMRGFKRERQQNEFVDVFSAI